jgi:glyoxylase I family protein
MIEVTGLSHGSFPVRDIDASKRFYGEVLGLKEVPRPAFDFPGAWYAVGDRQLHLIQNNRMPERVDDGRKPYPLNTHLALDVADVAAAKESLEAVGLTYREVHSPGDLWQLFVYDPDGNMIELLGKSAQG